MMKSMWNAVLMCPPTFFDVREPKNPHMGAAIDGVLSEHQWNNLRRAFENSGLAVEIINPVHDLDDMVFTANQAFIGQAKTIGKFIIPSRMRFPSRQKEVEHFVRWFQARGYQVVDLPLEGEYLEGHGDLIWHPDHRTIWAGYGYRSTKTAVDRFAIAMAELGFSVRPLQLVDPYCYHLDTCFCPLSSEAVLIYPDAFSEPALTQIKKGFQRVHELTREDAMGFVLNGVVANGNFITPRLPARLRSILAEEGLTPVLVETSEFEKSGGSVFCMKNFLP
jgi:N-dimethylarginine dimethylaminohydrolase